MPSPIQITRVENTDAARLLELSRRTFFDAFEHLNAAEDMEAFASKAFTFKTFEQQLNNPDSQFYYAMVDGEPAGYIKLNYRTAQTELQDAKSLEVERIYVLQQYQGQQIGKQLMEFSIQTAVDENLDYIWLGVWEHNAGAIRFYQSKGFEAFGSHGFSLGEDKQTDILMRKELV